MHFLISCIPYSFVHSSLVKDPRRNLFSSEVQIYLHSFSKLLVQSLAHRMKEDSDNLFCDFSTIKNGTLVSVSFPREGAISSVQSLSCVWLFETPWITAHQASLSITISRSSLTLTGCLIWEHREKWAAMWPGLWQRGAPRWLDVPHEAQGRECECSS